MNEAYQAHLSVGEYSPERQSEEILESVIGRDMSRLFVYPYSPYIPWVFMTSLGED